MKIPTNSLLCPKKWDISQRSFARKSVFYRQNTFPLIVKMLLLAFFTTLGSCIPTKKLTYLQETQTAQDSIIQVNLQQQPYRVQINDVLSIRVKALDQELVALFNPQTNGKEGNNLGESFGHPISGCFPCTRERAASYRSSRSDVAGIRFYSNGAATGCSDTRGARFI